MRYILLAMLLGLVGGGVKPMKKSVFKKRYVLATGHPLAMGIDPYDSIAMTDDKLGVGKRIRLKVPKEIWRRDIPKYRLVLERVD